MRERGGRLRLVPIKDAKMNIIEPELLKHISPDATLHTDESAVYHIIGKRHFGDRHRTINHASTYAIGDLHTNTIENAFSLLKRGVYGTFHKVSIKHLGRYCNEFSYRFNRRGEQLQTFSETRRPGLTPSSLRQYRLRATFASGLYRSARHWLGS